MAWPVVMHGRRREREGEEMGVGMEESVGSVWAETWAENEQRLGQRQESDLGRDLGRGSDSDCDGDSGLNCFAISEPFHYQFLIYLR